MISRIVWAWLTLTPLFAQGLINEIQIRPDRVSAEYGRNRQCVQSELPQAASPPGGHEVRFESDLVLREMAPCAEPESGRAGRRQ